MRIKKTKPSIHVEINLDYLEVLLLYVLYRRRFEIGRPVIYTCIDVIHGSDLFRELPIKCIEAGLKAICKTYKVVKTFPRTEKVEYLTLAARPIRAGKEGLYAVTGLRRVSRQSYLHSEPNAESTLADRANPAGFIPYMLEMCNPKLSTPFKSTSVTLTLTDKLNITNGKLLEMNLSMFQVGENQHLEVVKDINAESLQLALYSWVS